MNKKSYDKFFMNFSNPTRMAIITELKEKPMGVNEIAEKIGVEQSNVSHQLRSLVKCSILKVKKDGKKRIFSLNKHVVNPMLKMVESHVNSSCGPCNGNCAGCIGG